MSRRIYPDCQNVFQICTDSAANTFLETQRAALPGYNSPRRARFIAWRLWSHFLGNADVPCGIFVFVWRVWTTALGLDPHKKDLLPYSSGRWDVRYILKRIAVLYWHDVLFVLRIPQLKDKMATRIPTGYGSSTTKLFFDGDESKYKLWEMKFLGYLRIPHLHQTITNRSKWLYRFHRKERYRLRRAHSIFALQELIMRDAKDDERKALGILKER